MSRLIEVGLAMMDIRDENKALRADLEALAVAADHYLLDKTLKNYEALAEALACPGVQAVLEGVKDGE